MSFTLQFSKKAQDDISLHKKSGNKVLLNKVLNVLSEISNTPYTGIGKPEALKYELTGMWSRRINKEHRIVYEVKENQILIHSLLGHYN